MGGFVNAIISGPLESPHVVHIGQRKVGYSLGLIGNIIIGGTASFSFWALGLTSSVEPQVYGIAVVSGFGGARILTSLLEGQVARVERNILTDKAVTAATLLKEVKEISETEDEGMNADGTT